MPTQIIIEVKYHTKDTFTKWYLPGQLEKKLFPMETLNSEYQNHISIYVWIYKW